jgi:uncharacterized caspase-like protein
MKSRIKEVLFLFLLVCGVNVYAQEFEARTTPFRINLSVKDAVAPDVYLVYKNGGVINEDGKVKVEIRVFDVAGISQISINGTQMIEGDPVDSAKFASEFMNGEEILVIARDNFGNVKERSIIIKGQAADLNSSAKTNRKYYALLIGVNEYSDRAIGSLSEPIKDATLLKNLLTSKYRFEEANITLLKNPTFEDFDVVFSSLSNRITPDDLLLIFYAGHGYFDERTNIGYWLPSDAVKANRAKWFRNSALVENIAAINSKHTFLIADACFSGAIFNTRSVNNNASADISKMMRVSSRKALTSGKLSTVPDKSVFMKYLLKTLDENQNMYLPSEDLYDTIRLAMRNNSDSHPAYGEIKNAGDEGGNFVFIRRE